MADNLNIHSFKPIVPMIYAYTIPDLVKRRGWIKIGYTEKQTPIERVKQQTDKSTLKIHGVLEWQDNAMYKNGSGKYFDDHDFHHYLETKKKVERLVGSEWFHLDKYKSKEYFDSFASGKIYDIEGCEYILRQEQQDAVAMTKAYFENGGKEFLWNAKPRFGKTLTSYDLIRQMKLEKVLVVTNRPSIANSWAEDFCKFIGWRGELCFVSDTDALKGKDGVMTRETYMSEMSRLEDKDWKGIVAFESLQGLKTSVYFGGEYTKLGWMAKEYTDGYGGHRGLDFDLLIVDEAQEGVDTIRTDRVFQNISRKYTLYLSGTPFKALANEQFSKEQIYNWTYIDEQEAKANWSGEEYNPYEVLPRMAMYTYQLSNMIYDEIQKGIVLPGDDESVDYAFDLNEFFATNENGTFVHKDEIKKFLHALVTQKKYPFSTPKLRQELSHTLWLLNRVDSTKALARLLEEDPVFGEYKIVVAAGDGRINDDDAVEKAFDKVKTAIANNEKTITLSVGQLTVGVTIPEWNGVLMLCNLQSPSAYMQAAFRTQNPCVITKDMKRLRKETSYVFDFDPARTLIIFDEYANNLSPDTIGGRGTGEARKNNIKRLLNFFPVLSEDTEGEMVEIDAAQVLSIPRRIKCQEVVRRGFMSNFLFQNISNVFGAPSIVKNIIEKLTPAHEEPKKRDKDSLSNMAELPVNENGEVAISEELVIGKARGIFGEKYYEEMKESITPQIADIARGNNGTFDENMEQKINTLIETTKEVVKEKVIAPIAEEYDVKPSLKNRIEKETDRDIEAAITKVRDDFKQKAKIAKAELEVKREEADTEEKVAVAETAYNKRIQEALNEFMDAVDTKVRKTIDDKPQEVIERIERHKAEKEKKTIEDSIRDHLRGFSRTIPSFIMAYGDGKLTLQNFDKYTEEGVFSEVTGITVEDFRFLRDGGDYPNEETGETEHFNGHLFDEVVFDDSVEEFWNKKQTLKDYFDESHTEDIFDYIPPQKTNQIFTPKWVVSKMVDELEANNPGCFDNPKNTFADLYMKSGLYITEIVKRLFRSKKMKQLYPNDKERVEHILQEQVYGMAPTRIIYLIATNYILGFDENLKLETKNFVQADAAQAAKDGKLKELVDKHFKK